MKAQGWLSKVFTPLLVLILILALVIPVVGIYSEGNSNTDQNSDQNADQNDEQDTDPLSKLENDRIGPEVDNYPYLSIKQRAYPAQIYILDDVETPNNSTVSILLTGEGEPIHGNKISAPADIVFVVDSTGSMLDEIYEVQTKIENITKNITDKVSNVQFGLATYTDHPGYYDDCGYDNEYGGETDWGYRIEQMITNDVDQFINAVKSIQMGSGGDAPEAVSDAIYNTTHDFNWRGGDVVKMAILMGDSVGHDCDHKYGNLGTYNTTGSCPYNLTIDDVVTDTVTNNVIWATIGMTWTEKNNTVAWAQWKYIAEQSSGVYRALGAGDIAKVIIDLIGEVLPTIYLAGENARIIAEIPEFIHVLDDTIQPPPNGIMENTYIWEYPAVAIGESYEISFNIQSSKTGWDLLINEYPGSKLEYMMYNGSEYDKFTMVPIPKTYIDVISSNSPPIAAVNGPFIINEGETIELDASASADPEDNDLIYRWDFNSDGRWDTYWMNEPEIEYTYGDDWTGQIMLEVKEYNTTEQFFSNTTALVMVKNVAPEIIVPNQIIINETDTAFITAVATDPGSDDLTFNWLWGVGNGTEFNYTYFNNPPGPDIYPSFDIQPSTYQHSSSLVINDSGIYNVFLVVEDDDSGKTVEEISVIVLGKEKDIEPDNKPPEATLKANPVIGFSPLKVNFAGNGFDPDGLIVAYSWDFDDGFTDEELLNQQLNTIYSIPVHIFTEPGIYQVKFMVKDDMGATDFDTVTIVVNEKVEPPQEPCILSGYVYEIYTSKVIPEANITIGEIELKTNATGFYCVELPPGEYYILAVKEYYMPETKYIVVSENVNKNIFLTPLQTINRTETKPVKEMNKVDIWIIFVIIIVIIFLTLLINEYLKKKKLRKKQNTD
jgi:PKD repeat protein